MLAEIKIAIISNLETLYPKHIPQVKNNMIKWNLHFSISVNCTTSIQMICDNYENKHSALNHVADALMPNGSMD